MRPFPADLIRMWPISTRVNKPENADPSIVEADCVGIPVPDRRNRQLAVAATIAPLLTSLRARRRGHALFASAGLVLNVVVFLQIVGEMTSHAAHHLKF